MAGTLAEHPVTSFVPRFHQTQPDRIDWKRLSYIALASVIIHIGLGVVGRSVFSLPGRRYTGPEVRIQRPQQVTKLVVPPLSVLTQKAPSRGPVTPEFDISSLPPRPSQPSAPASPGAAATPRQRFSLPERQLPGIRTPSMAGDLPSVDTGQLRTGAPAPALGTQLNAPPPPPEPPEKPKLAFERPGANTGMPAGAARIQVPKPTGSIDDAARQAARPGGRGLIVGDEDAVSGASPVSPAVPIPGKLGSAVELLSDPMGADFWPYLVKVLSSVRRNWFAVVPESARFGRAGRTVIQFAINKDGSVPKLVIAGPSGTDALDRAAVAGISASNPFPPLPPEFKGSQVRLQFVFKYNVK